MVLIITSHMYCTKEFILGVNAAQENAPFVADLEMCVAFILTMRKDLILEEVVHIGNQVK